MAPIKVDLREEKRRVIEEGDRCRHAITAEFQNIKAATAWVPKTVGVVRATSPLLALAAPLIGFFIRRKRRADPKHIPNGTAEKQKQGLVGKTFLALEILRKMRPWWDSFQHARRRRERARSSAPDRSPLERK